MYYRRTASSAQCIISTFIMLFFSTMLHADMTRQAYIAKYAHLAVAEMRRSGIPASITLAQAILESDCGNSDLARASNNHFGIKCKAEWNGRTVHFDDDEPGECFRRYSSVRDSYRDHSEFLRNRDRYAQLFALSPTDYKGWARGLKAAGYATNPNYATSLIRIIEENKLTRYDRARGGNTSVSAPQVSELTILSSAAASAAEVISPAPVESAAITSAESPLTAPTQSVQSNSSVTVPADGDIQTYRRAGFGRLKPGQINLDDATAYPNSYLIILERKIWTNNGVKCVLARENDSMQDIAADLGCSVGRLCRFNEVPRQYVPQSGEMIYIKKKRVMYERPHITHVVASGESIRSIAQDYGIRTSVLYRNNNLAPDTLIYVGQVLIIQP